MQKICILFFSISFTVAAFAQKKTNPKIDKNETEIASFIIVDDYLAYGAQLAYRFSVTKKLKIGAGMLYGANTRVSAVTNNTYGYGAVFADALKFTGQRQKWGVGGQIGHGIYNEDYGYSKLKAGIYYSLSWNYRAIVSKDLLLTISLFSGHRNFHYKSIRSNPDGYYSFLLGLKLGVVF